MTPLLLLTYVNASSPQAIISSPFTVFDHDGAQTQSYIVRNELLSIQIKGGFVVLLNLTQDFKIGHT